MGPILNQIMLSQQFDTSMELKFNPVNSNSDSTEVHQTAIFGKDFQVDPIQHPEDFLPRYQANQRQYQQSATQSILVCCGKLQIFCCYPCACCCCVKKHSFTYNLNTSYAGLVQTFGRFSRLLKPGFNFINPCSQTVFEVDMKTRVVSVGRNPTITKDNVKLQVEASVCFRITNPIIAHYVLAQRMNQAVVQLAISSLREVIANSQLSYVLSERLKIVETAKKSMAKGMPQGLAIQNIFMQELIIPHQIENDLTATARQIRISEANIINSKADVQTAALMKQSAQLLNSKAAMQIRYLQMVEQLGKKGVVLLMDIGANKKGYKQ